MSAKESVIFRCIPVHQPLGDFFIGAISSKDLCGISYADVRRVAKEEAGEGFETYLGIQRKLSPRRVKDIVKYLASPDACFPTAVILAVPPECAEYDKKTSQMILSPYKDEDIEIPLDEIAKIIDGQHRIAGLKDYAKDDFFVNVSIFVAMDIADQAYLFSTVNLAQTKVNKSLVYDLFELANHRSPQKVCHNIAVALDKTEKSPFYQRIMRLGVATEGRFSERITQATFVESLLKTMTDDPVSDRSLYLSNKRPKLADRDQLQKLYLRNMLIEEKDLDITDIIWNYFAAVRNRWPNGWDNISRGNVLNQSMGFRAFMRFLKEAYLNLVAPGKVPTVDQFLSILKKIKADENVFTIDNFKPGSAGEAALFGYLKTQSGL